MSTRNIDIDSSLIASPDLIEEYFDRLWPICRSITGNGFRRSLEILREIIPLQVTEVPTGTRVFDWTVPNEWNIEEAFVLGPDGERIIDFSRNNLHVVSYSMPVDQEMSLDELDRHLYSLPDMPDAIPYYTSYYKPHWGFCMAHSQRALLKPGKYRAVIKSRLEKGSLTYGDLLLPATRETKQEILLSTYLCHPSMANNELSGPLVTSFVYDYLRKLPYRKFNYRFVFIPETIGSITYLSRWGEHLSKNCIAGLVVTSCGDPHGITFKRSRRGNTLTDTCAEDVVNHHGRTHGKSVRILDFFPSGSDERQYCSPGFDLPIGSLMRSLVSEYREYHTSLDDKSFISFSAMVETIELYLKTLFSIEAEGRYMNTQPMCEPNLGSRGLYPTLGSSKQQSAEVKRIMYLLNYSDGKHSLSEIARKAGCSILDLAATTSVLEEKGLIIPAEDFLS